MDDGKLWIDFVDLLRRGVGQGNWIGTGANYEVGSPTAGAVHVEGGCIVESELANIPDDADNRRPAWLRIERAQIDAPADEIGAGPEALGERFIHDQVRASEIRGGEEAAFDERDSHCGEVAEICVARLSDGASTCFRNGLAFDEKARSGTKRSGE